MSRLHTVLFATLAWPALAAASPSVVDPTRVDALPTPPGVVGGAVGGFLNPAAWAMGGGELAFTWDDHDVREDTLDDWGLSIAAPLGFAVRRSALGSRGQDAGAIWDYRLGLAWGDRGTSGGLAWRWAPWDADGADEGPVFGFIERPAPWVSVGASTFLATTSSFREASMDLGVRPLGTSMLTLFGSGGLATGQSWDDASWS